MKIVVTGGGTGGHIYPALSIARQLRKQGAELLFVGSQHGPEGRLAALDGLDFRAVPSGPIAGMSLRTARSLVKLGLGVVKSFQMLGEFRPDVVIGTGGYTSAGVLVAGCMRGIPIVIHEQNSIPGKTNRALARIANRVCVTFDESLAYFPKGKSVVTGLPVRESIVEGMEAREARRSLQLDPEKFTVLVTGGSQGARRINDAVLEAVPALVQAGLQVLHLVGSKNYGDVVSRKPDVDGYVAAPYMDDMAAAYSAADLVVSRSGASTIAEITVRGLPSVLIPYPFAYAGHQLKNAEAVAKVGAGVVIEESELTASSLVQTILILVADPSRLAEMASWSRSLGRPNAAQEIAEIVQEVASRKLIADG